MPRHGAQNYDGIETTVRLMKESKAFTKNLHESLTAEQLKQMFNLYECKNLEVSVIYHEGRLETIKDDEQIGDRLVSCKEILILPMGDSRKLDLTSFEASSQSKAEPYQWFSELPEDTRQRLVDSSDIATLAYCLGHEWRNVIMTLGIPFGQLQIAEKDHKTKANELNPETQLLNYWIQCKGKSATYEAFIGPLKIFEKVCPGSIRWENIREIFHKGRNLPS